MNENESGPSTPASSAEDTFARFPRWWAAGICALTFLTYLGTLRFQFVHDDRGQIVGNPAVHSWQAVPGYFTAHVWAAIAPTNFVGNDYRPLFLLWLRINDAVFGAHAAGWHFTTVAAHVAATYCVILLAHRVFREWTAALFSGVIFGLHPVHIEGVAWISGVPEPLLAALLIPAYLCWLRFREATDRRGAWLAASLCFYTLALLTKETAVVFLLILIASDWLGFPDSVQSPRPRGVRAAVPLLKSLAPYLLLTAAYVAARTLALRGFSHPAAQISWLTVLLTWPPLLLFYLKLLVWPVGLSPFYGLQFVTHPTMRNTVLPVIVLVLCGAAMVRWAARRRAVALAVPWLIFPVLPVLAVQVFGNGNFAHNRYLYLPSVGFAMLAAAALRSVPWGKPLYGALPCSQVAICLALAFSFILAVQLEDRYYTNDAAFYSYAYARMGNHDAIIGMDYANTLAEQGQFDRAAEIYRGLIQARPEMWDACFNLGYMYYQAGRPAEAVPYLARAAGADPPRAAPFLYLGLAQFKLNQMDTAEANLRRAVALAPTAPNYHFALGMVLQVRGKLPEAEAAFRQELDINPGNQAAAQQAAETQQRLVPRR
jgi:tetratricopeptide (TPR) repeat protein